MRRATTLASAVLAVALTLTSAHADEPRGTWAFTDASKPVKVVVLGGSVSEYGLGGYAQWLPAACGRIEVHNAAKARLGAAALKERFVAQILKNRKVDPKAQETWLVFLGGLNSVGTPELTNVDVAKTFKMAHDAGMRTMGLTINPWGSDGDHRWKGADGLAYQAHTQKTVDFVMGRLTPAQAFGKAGEGKAQFEAGQLPDVGVDLWDSVRRDREAPLRTEKAMARSAKLSPWVKKQLAGLDEQARQAAFDGYVQRAMRLPQWYMKPEFVAFDPVHPNAAGHKEIARMVCQKAPPSWGCDCAVFDGLAWDRRARKPVRL
ncbi:MAG: hypothetical protein U1F43_23950 [Myxococcota bacterium]